jgi:drug/metabolite transporter (DMT)-like permease
MFLVLLGALLHASWNAIVKSGADKLKETGLIAAGSALVCVIALPFIPLPLAASLPWLVASVVIHQIYFALVAAAYRAGDMGHTYPLMRGTAPMLVALASAPLLGERLSPPMWCGVILICGGILLLAIHRRAKNRATLLALANAVVIALYTFVDSAGVRRAGVPESYVLWLMALNALPLLAWLCWRDAAGLVRTLRARWPAGLAGGACSVASYGLALWAMTRAPVAAVAALRETSVLFAVAISLLVLGEGGGMRRAAAAACVVAGAAALKLT